ncbi:MAG: gluconate 5-dehydrogenase [Bacteroidales bacterium]|nr:gluconate 5-dehydrogenase [Bacteroidales bacterium]
MATDLFDLKGKIALVTGGTHGLGMAIAVGLAEAGAKIIVNDLSAEKLENAKNEYSKKGIDVSAYLFDVTDEASVDKGITTIEKEVGPVDILVNNAGIIRRIPLLDMEVPEFELVMKVDVTGPFIMSKRVVKSMVTRGKGGKIINMCSMMSEVGRHSVGAYAAAKGGLKMLTKNMAVEWARYNIQVNGIAPGYFATEQTAPIRVDGHPFNELIMTRTPMNRWGHPDELQGTAVYLASKASDFVTGILIYVDGGMLATLGKTKLEE